jgi:RND superfamily putative drug exporter
VLVYGLSMDYEVFIVSRMREEWERNGGDTQAAIATGLQRTGGVVTSAAAIMVAVFSAFMLTRVPEIKQFGFGLAAAIAIDATIVRAALVPAVMRIAGRWNWWQPRWLERLLDRVPLAPEASS